MDRKTYSREVTVIRGVWGFITVAFRFVWEAMIWTLARDRWQISVGMMFCTIAVCVLGVPVIRYMTTLQVLARWQFGAMLLAVVTLLTLGGAFLYSYSVDRSKATWLETREAEAERAEGRAQKAFDRASHASNQALINKVQVLKHMGGGQFMGVGMSPAPPELPEPEPPQLERVEPPALEAPAMGELRRRVGLLADQEKAQPGSPHDGEQVEPLQLTDDEMLPFDE